MLVLGSSLEVCHFHGHRPSVGVGREVLAPLALYLSLSRERCWCCVGGVVAAVRENFDINFSY